MFGKVSDDSFTHIFDLSLDSEDSRLGSSYNGNKMSSNTSSPMSSRRDFSSPSSTISTPSSASSSLPLEAAFSQFAASFSSLLQDKDSAASAALNLDKKISELERLRNKINHADNHSSASSTTSSNGSGQTKVNTSRYKTELCRPFSEHGTCKYGEKCQFAHGQGELRSVTRHPKYKTDLCRTYHSVGFCPYGPRCHFVHNLDEAVAQQQARPAPAPATPTVNKQPIGSGRREDQQQQQQKFKPLPMFDNSKTSWNPLNSNLFNNVESEQQHHHQQQQLHQLQGSARLPVFSTLSK